MTPTDKAGWRAWARETRAGLPDASASVCAGLAPFLADSGARVVLAYRAFGGEPSLDALVEARPDVSWLVPRTNPGGLLSLHPWAAATQRSAFGLLEPPPGEPLLDPLLVDLALVPGLAYDARGGRLGSGRGHYDRLLQGLRRGVVLVGVTRDALVVPSLPADPWDVAVGHLATESGVRRV